MKLARIDTTRALVWRPSVLGTIAYACLFAVVVLWTLGTVEPYTFPDNFLAPRFAGLSLFHALTGIHVILFVLLASDLPAAFRAPAGIRKGHVAGVIGAMILVALMQTVAISWRSFAELLESGSPVVPGIEMEAMEMPLVENARPLFYDPRTEMIPVQIPASENCIAELRRLYEPEIDEFPTILEEFLREQVERVDRRPLDPSRSDGALETDAPLLVLADRTVRFSRIVHVARVGMQEDIGIRKLWLGVERPEGRDIGAYPLHLSPPVDGGSPAPDSERDPHADDIDIHVRNPGRKLSPYFDGRPYDPSVHLRFRFSDDRAVGYSWRGRSTSDLTEFAGWLAGETEILIPELAPGVTWGELAAVLDALHANSREDLTLRLNL